jgi:hypothetical protein
MNWLIEWWHRRQRLADLTILWPSIRDQASDFERAKQAFRLHAYCDRAWNGISGPDIDAMLEARRK